MLRICVAAFGVGLAIAPAATAQQPLTLDDAVSRALTANPSVRAAHDAEQIAAARTDGARAGYWPRVDFVESWQRGNDPVFVFGSKLSARRFGAADFLLPALNHPNAMSSHRTALTTEQLIFDGSATRAAVRTADLGRHAAALELARAEAAVRLDVVRAYGRVLAATSLHDAAVAAAAAAEEDLARARHRRDAGRETDAGVLALQVRVDEAAVERVRAEGEARIARAGLNAVMAAPLDAVFALAPFVAITDTNFEIARLERQAIANRPEIAAATTERQIAIAAQDTMRSAFFPAVVAQGTVQATGGTFMSRAGAWVAGVQLRWNVFAGGADTARTRAAAAAVRAADARREALETSVRLEVRTSLARAETAAARQRLAARMVDEARESQRIFRDRYEAGLASVVDLLRAAETVARAEAAQVTAMVDARVAVAELEHATATTGGIR